jgi:hypothetical protein
MVAMDDDEGDCVAAAGLAGVEHKPQEPLMQPVHSSAAVVAAENFAAVVGAVEGTPLVFFRWIQSLAEAVVQSGLGDWRAWQERNLKRLGKLSISHIRQHPQILLLRYSYYYIQNDTVSYWQSKSAVRLVALLGLKYV